jgi:hypothetical protein
MVAREVVEASVTTTAPFCAAVVEIVGAAACGLVGLPDAVPPPLPQPASKNTLTAIAHRNRNCNISAIKPDSLPALTFDSRPGG